MKVAAASQQVTVQDNAGPAVSTEASNNASATIIKGNDLDALSDDPEDLQADLEALAGPSAGPSGGAIFVDGLERRTASSEGIDSRNPHQFESVFAGVRQAGIWADRDLHEARFDKFHGSAGYNLGTDRWNSRNPYAAAKAPFLLQETEKSFSGPLTKRSSHVDYQLNAAEAQPHGRDVRAEFVES